MRRRSGVSAVGVVASCVLIGAAGGCGSSDATELGVSAGGGEAPPLADYGHIPLPTSAPPPGALVDVASYADPSASGQGIDFRYQGFTIRACYRQVSVAAPDACLPQQGVSVFRTVKGDDAETLFTVSTKNFAALPAEAAGALRFFTTAELAPRPEWLPDYVAREYSELVGK